MRRPYVLLCMLILLACSRERDDSATRGADATASPAELSADSGDAPAGRTSPDTAADLHSGHASPAAADQPQQHTGHASPAAADQPQQHAGHTPPPAAARADQQHAAHTAVAQQQGAQRADSTQHQHAAVTAAGASTADTLLRDLVAALLADTAVLRLVRTDTALARAWSDPRVRQQLGSHH